MIAKVINRSLPPWAVSRLKRVLAPLGMRVPNNRNKYSSITDNAYEAVVTEVRHENSRTVTLEFELLGGFRLNYKSGQFVTLSLPIGHVLFQRAYAISSAPSEDRYTITVQKAFQGRVSSYLNDQIRVGDKFYIDDPVGSFVLPEVQPLEQRYLLVAGGIGIVPMFSLIKDLLSKNANADIQLVYASRSEEHAVFLKQLEKMTREYPGFEMRTQFTRRSDLGHDPYRRLDGDKIISRVSDPSSALIYVCGPYGLLLKCFEAFGSIGIAESRIKIQSFNSAPKSLVMELLKPRSISFIPTTPFGSKISHIRQTQVETVLDTSRQAGITIPQKCSAGNCGSCKIKVKSGMVVADEPNNLSIEDALGGSILACMSYPCEPLIVKLPTGR